MIKQNVANLFIFKIKSLLFKIVTSNFFQANCYFRPQSHFLITSRKRVFGLHLIKMDILIHPILEFKWPILILDGIYFYFRFQVKIVQIVWNSWDFRDTDYLPCLLNAMRPWYKHVQRPRLLKIRFLIACKDSVLSYNCEFWLAPNHLVPKIPSQIATSYATWTLCLWLTNAIIQCLETANWQETRLNSTLY